MTPELAPPSPNYHTNGRMFELSTDLTCIAALHGGSVVVLAVALSTIQVTERFSSVSPPIWSPWAGQGLPTSLPLPPTSREDGLLKYPHVEKALYIFKHPCLLQDSNPGPTAQQSASLGCQRILDG
ncbi:hypothetical protein TNCV_1175961 [Trichonephila clavipes]|nr:hypothetical protein TNCV_1175961 [Trichonephila clavipes]